MLNENDEFVKWLSIESTLEFKENSTKVLVLFNDSMNNGTIKLLCDIDSYMQML